MRRIRAPERSAQRDPAPCAHRPEQALERSVDLLVATPQRVMQHNDKGNLFYGDVEVGAADDEGGGGWQHACMW